jgi:hypothetical protein
MLRGRCCSPVKAPRESCSPLYADVNYCPPGLPFRRLRSRCWQLPGLRKADACTHTRTLFHLPQQIDWVILQMRPSMGFFLQVFNSVE